MSASTIIAMRPLVLSPDETAQVLGLSLPVVQKMVTQGEFPPPRQLSTRRVGYLLTEVEAWLESRPVSSCLPPPNSGYGRTGKPGKDGDDAGGSTQAH